MFQSQFKADCIAIIGREKARQISARHPKKSYTTGRGKVITSFATKEAAEACGDEIRAAAKATGPALFAQIAPKHLGGTPEKTRLEMVAAAHGYALPRAVLDTPPAETVRATPFIPEGRGTGAAARAALPPLPAGQVTFMPKPVPAAKPPEPTNAKGRTANAWGRNFSHVQNHHSQTRAAIR